MDRRAPHLDETPSEIDDGVRGDLERALTTRAMPAGTAVHVEGKQGPKAAVVCVVIGGERRAHELFVFARAPTSSEALDRCIDYVDGVVRELARAGEERFLPLDWEGRPFGDAIVYVRGEVRDYLAEEQAAALLGEPVPARALAQAVIH